MCTIALLLDEYCWLHLQSLQILYSMLCKHTLICGRLFAVLRYKQQCMSLLCYTLTFSCLCSAVLPIRCFGRCVRYTCWQTRFLCVRLSGSGCLTPPVSLVWRQVRGGHVTTVSSDPVPCETWNPVSYTHFQQHSPEHPHLNLYICLGSKYG